ncbi:MAG: 16S rRNA (adenine(1518)-N(6)/adenine(1519)-N(6))-dimethyltransferase RsmA [Nitrososphaerota archaeon]
MKYFRYGEHFLVDPAFIELFVKRSGINAGDKVLEIGTGLGTITKEVAKAGCYVRSFETNTRLYRTAKHTLSSYNNIEIINSDALKFTSDGFDIVLSSLPYYISSRFITWLCKQKTPLAVVILQREFVEKLISPPGTKHYGAYSVIAKYCFNAEPMDVIPPEAFSPKPKVFSQIVRFLRRKTIAESESLIKSLKFLFSFRGKTLKSTERIIKKHFPNFEFGINQDKRIEDLSIDEAIMAAQKIG